jgi:hypothetical protein
VLSKLSCVISGMRYWDFKTKIDSKLSPALFVKKTAVVQKMSSEGM